MRGTGTRGVDERAGRLARADLEARRQTELAIQRCRGWAVLVGVAQSAVYPGDRPALGWAAIVILALTWLAHRAVLRRRPSSAALARAGAAVMAADALVVALLLANLLRDPTDPIQMLPLLLAAEGAMRWGRAGGIAASLGAGAMTATWAVVVHALHDLPLRVGFVTFRLALIVLIGTLLGNTVSAVRQQRRLAALVCDGSSDLIASFEPDGRIRTVNPACEAILGYRPDEMIGRDRAEFLAPGQRRRLPRPDPERLRSGTRLEMCFQHRDGRPVWIELDLQVDEGDGGRLYAIGRDVSARRRAEDDLRHRAEHDALTGAANRAHLLARLARELAGPRRLFLLFADLDGFKAVNDAHGHRAGDAVLVEVVARIRAVARPSDLVVRLAGDELCVLLPAPVSEGEAHDAARAIDAEVARPFRVDGEDIRITASVGVAASLPSDRPSTLLERADRAMYARKRARAARGAAPPPVVPATDVGGPAEPVPQIRAALVPAADVHGLAG